GHVAAANATPAPTPHQGQKPPRRKCPPRQLPAHLLPDQLPAHLPPDQLPRPDQATRPGPANLLGPATVIARAPRHPLNPPMRAPLNPPMRAPLNPPMLRPPPPKPCLASAESAKTAAARISAAHIDTLFNIGTLLMTEILSGLLTPMKSLWSQW